MGSKAIGKVVGYTVAGASIAIGFMSGQPALGFAVASQAVSLASRKERQRLELMNSAATVNPMLRVYGRAPIPFRAV